MQAMLLHNLGILHATPPLGKFGGCQEDTRAVLCREISWTSWVFIVQFVIPAQQSLVHRVGK